jgi:hypothetical protein
MEPNNSAKARQSAGCGGEIRPQILFRELCELVAVLLGKGRASPGCPDPSAQPAAECVPRSPLRKSAPFLRGRRSAILWSALYPGSRAGGRRPLVSRRTSPRGPRSYVLPPARSGPPRGRRRSPHDSGGGGERTMRARRDDVVVDRIGAVRILVTDLDNHPSSYRILDDFTFVRTNGESSVSRHHVFAPFYRSNVGQAHSMIRLSRSLPA